MSKILTINTLNQKNTFRLGLKENWAQFTLLVLVNALVGGMVGMERTIFPQFAEQVFGIGSKTAILSFIIAFGLSKAVTNYFTGKMANFLGRKHLLIIGWVLALPVPLMLMYARHWPWIVAANVLLGISQGLAWSSTVVMKIDLVGEKDRGLAMGLNEFAGYLAVGVMAFFTAYLADKWGIIPYPFYPGIAISILGLIISIFWVKDTRHFVAQEAQQQTPVPLLDHVFWQTTFRHKTLSSVTQAGFINNLNDGMMWGLFPMVLAAAAFDTDSIGILTAAYPAIWGVGQLFTGKMADHFSQKKMLFWGMLVQGVAIIFIPFVLDFNSLLTLAAILGLGTALVYPTFLSVIAQATSPQQRAESMGIFRLWRDLGYVFGAVLSGITADLFGLAAAVIVVGSLTFASAWVIFFRMR
jgi:MFS family permease